MKITRAIISVSCKEGLEALVKQLDSLGVEILSTGGTSKKIASFGVKVKEVSEYTGFGEMMDGRVKTLHPKIHAGLLADRDNKSHMKQLEEQGILPIDMVVVNLYPFEKTVAREGTTLEEAVENIDIGGPTMLRSAAKNYKHVAVISSSRQYEKVVKELKKTGGELTMETSAKLAQEVFSLTSRYDSAISEYLLTKTKEEKTSNALPHEININLKKVKDLRYGENPHQKAAFYAEDPEPEGCIIKAEQLQGKELSFNNILDLNAAVSLVREFSDPAAVIVKHNNPCGAAVAKAIKEAYIDALDCDRMSAFGSIMAFNRKLDGASASLIIEEADFIECIIAPDYDKAALEIFKVKKNLRVLKFPEILVLPSNELDIRKIHGGALVQDADRKFFDQADMKAVTDQKPTDECLGSLKFAQQVVKHVKSNAIVLAQGTKTVGIGAGQMSRVDSVRIAISKAGEKAKGAVLASDAFFPKSDSIDEASKTGISAIIQPGGSIRDQEVIDACNKYGIPMVFTGLRHFKH